MWPGQIGSISGAVEFSKYFQSPLENLARRPKYVDTSRRSYYESVTDGRTDSTQHRAVGTNNLANQSLVWSPVVTATTWSSCDHVTQRQQQLQQSRQRLMASWFHQQLRRCRRLTETQRCVTNQRPLVACHQRRLSYNNKGSSVASWLWRRTCDQQIARVTQINSAFYPSGVDISSIGLDLAGVKAGQVHLCRIAGNNNLHCSSSRFIFLLPLNFVFLCLCVVSLVYLSLCV